MLVDRPSAHQPGVQLVPVSHAFFTQLPAQADGAPAAPGWKIDQAALRILQLTADGLEFFLEASEPGNALVASPHQAASFFQTYRFGKGMQSSVLLQNQLVGSDDVLHDAANQWKRSIGLLRREPSGAFTPARHSLARNLESVQFHCIPHIGA
jgi:hypothetical protein